MRYLAIARMVFWGLVTLVTVLTLTPNPESLDGGMSFTRWLASVVFGDPSLEDKIAHFGAYGVLGAAAVWARIAIRGRIFWTIAALALYGVLLESAQSYIGGRMTDGADALANTLGLLAAYPIASGFYRILPGKGAP